MYLIINAQIVKRVIHLVDVIIGLKSRYMMVSKVIILKEL